MVRIEITPNKIVKDHTTVWQQPGPQVDIAMDLKALSFRPNSVTQIVTFHTLDHFFPEEVPVALKNWRDCLMPGGVLYIVVDDFEYISRAVVGGDISVDIFNREHNNPTQMTQKSLADALMAVGFDENNIVAWMQDVPDLFKKKHYELVLAAKK